MSNTILITGSSTGIGRATAKHFQAQGWNVIATMRSPEKETELKELDNVLVNRLDVTDLESINLSVSEGIHQFGHIDVVLNNAGYGLAGPFEAIPRENITRQFDVNVFGLMDVTRAVLPHLRSRGSGTIINVSSVGGRMTFPLFSLYHATKWAVEGLSESMHYELSPLGITVKILEPGGVATDFAGRSLDFQHDEKLTDYNETVGKVTASFESLTDPSAISTPEHIADIIYGAATDGSSQLRYRAGEDANQMLTARQQLPESDFFNMVRERMGMK